jgi:hypothetical protein
MIHSQGQNLIFPHPKLLHMQKANTNPSTQHQRNGEANTITYFFPQPKLLHMQEKETKTQAHKIKGMA